MLVVTKHDIVTALQTENLMFDGWIDRREDELNTSWALAKFDPNCAACAVGSVLKRKVSVDRVENFSRICVNATQGRFSNDDTANPGNWLGALSIVWEYMNTHNDFAGGPEALRPNIIRWAEDNIPEDYVARIKA